MNAYLHEDFLRDSLHLGHQHNSLDSGLVMFSVCLDYFRIDILGPSHLDVF